MLHDSTPGGSSRSSRRTILGTVWTTQAFLPLLEAGRPARLVNVVSVAGTVSTPPMGPYAPSKHAQLAFSRAAAAELAPRGIRVLTVNPGFVHTEGFPNRERLRNPLLRRVVVEPERVATHILDALDRGAVETFVPRWYRVPALVQALAPGHDGAVARPRRRTQNARVNAPRATRSTSTSAWRSSGRPCAASSAAPSGSRATRA